jgi:hypothetical protein
VGVFNVSADLLNAWTPTNRVTDIPSLRTINVLHLMKTQIDIWLIKLLYARFATIGYDVPKKNLERTRSAVFCSGENLFTFSKNGWDAGLRVTLISVSNTRNFCRFTIRILIQKI